MRIPQKPSRKNPYDIQSFLPFLLAFGLYRYSCGIGKIQLNSGLPMKDGIRNVPMPEVLTRPVMSSHIICSFEHSIMSTTIPRMVDLQNGPIQLDLHPLSH